MCCPASCASSAAILFSSSSSLRAAASIMDDPFTPLTPPTPPFFACQPVDSIASAKATSKSAMRSSTSSMPALIRTRSSGRPRSALTSAGMDACDMKHGREMSEAVLPNDTVILNSSVFSTTILLRFTSPVANDRMLPVPVAWDLCKP